ncbi:MAG: hypothetical protein ACK5L5_04525 [Bacteroidales bacterium]
MKIKATYQLLAAQLLELRGRVLVLFKALRKLAPETSSGLALPAIFIATPLTNYKNRTFLRGGGEFKI